MSINKKVIQEAIKKYATFQNSKEYKKYYRAYKSLKDLIDSEIVDDDICYLYARFEEIICKRWKLKCPISPNYSINKDRLIDEKINNRTSIGKIIYATGFSDDICLKPDEDFKKVDVESILNEKLMYNYYTKRQSRTKDKKIQKQERLGIEKEHWQYVMYILSTTMRLSRRTLSRLFDIHHSTASRHLKIVEGWSDEKKHMILSEMQTGKYNTGDVFKKVSLYGDESYVDHLSTKKSSKR